jgi:hypothetical protein
MASKWLLPVSLAGAAAGPVWVLPRPFCTPATWPSGGGGGLKGLGEAAGRATMK